MPEGWVNEDNNATGDFNICPNLTISGASAASTIIQAGTNASKGIDEVFGLNPICIAGVSVTIQNVTIRYGRNTQPYNIYGDWGFIGVSLPHNNMMHYLALTFIIALQGIYPSRP
jgi:microcystin-dependent protein